MLKKCLVFGLIVVIFTLSLQGVLFAQQVVTLRVVHAWPPVEMERQKKLDEEFMKKYPNIKLQVENATWSELLTKYQTQAAAKALPDVYYLHYTWAQMLIRNGMLLNLQPFIDKDPSFNLKDFFPVTLVPYKDKKGDIYAIPYDCNSYPLYYNIDLFKKAGLAFPNSKWRLDKEFLETAIKLTIKDDKGRIIQWGLDGNFSQLPADIRTSQFEAFGARDSNDEETELYITEPKAIEAVKWWTDLVVKYHVAPTPAEAKAIVQPFSFGKVAMSYGGPYDLERWAQYGSFKVNVEEMPIGPSGIRPNAIAGSAYGISPFTQHPKEAWLYLKFYMSKESLEFMWSKPGALIPARRSAGAPFENWWREKGLNAKVFRKAIEYSKYGHFISPAGPEVNQIFGREIQLILLGQKTVEDALNKIEQDALPVLAKYNK